MARVGFEPTFSAGERPKTCALDRAATGTGFLSLLGVHNVAALLCELHVFHVLVKKPFKSCKENALAFPCVLSLSYYYYCQCAPPPSQPFNEVTHSCAVSVYKLRCLRSQQ